MSWAVWGLLLLVVFPLLQIPLIVYLSRRVETDEKLPPVWGRGYAFDPRPGTDIDDPDRPPATATPPTRVTISGARATLICRRCGVENDSLFTYCRGCVERLR